MIAIVDAGSGNLRSVAKALAHVGAEVEVTSAPEVVERAERLVVPGQGAFGDCARAVGRDTALGRAVLGSIERGRPYLGICLGLQILFEASDEAPGCAGLGLLAGRVERIPAGMRDSSGAPLKVPHMGWNDVVPGRVPHPLLAGGPTPYYFVHSYHAVPRELEWVAGIVEYGERALVAAVARKNVFAVQFHPEKSQRAGLELLERFVGWSP